MRTDRELGSALAEGVQAGALVIWVERASRRRLEAAERGQRADRAREAVEGRRTDVVEAHRRVRLLERLRERALAEYRVERGRVAQRELDEVGRSVWARRSGVPA